MEIEDNIHSEEIEEIMERMPRKFIKWGSGAIVILILILVVLSTIIEYPDTIEGSVLLTTKNPPVSVVAGSSGTIEKLFVQDKSQVQDNEPLAILESRVDYKSVFLIDSILNNTGSFRSEGSNILNYPFWMEQETKIEDLGSLTYSFSNFLRSLKAFYLENKKHLPLEDVLSNADDKELYDKAWSVITARESLQTSISLWKDRYLLKSITAGTVSFQTFWSENQVINSRDEFCKIVSDNKNILCKVQIPIDGSAKVKPNQKVRIVLPSYPENEYGFLEGEVQTISEVPFASPAGSFYLVSVGIKIPLTTSMKKQIAYLPEMRGTAEIITEKKTIMDRLTESFLSHWRKSQS